MASITLSASHPQLTVSRSINMGDAKLVEFADFLRNDYFNDDTMTRQAAVRRFFDEFLDHARAIYRSAKHREAVLALPVPGEIDA